MYIIKLILILLVFFRVVYIIKCNKFYVLSKKIFCLFVFVLFIYLFCFGGEGGGGIIIYNFFLEIYGCKKKKKKKRIHCTYLKC